VIHQADITIADHTQREHNDGLAFFHLLQFHGPPPRMRAVEHPGIVPVMCSARALATHARHAFRNAFRSPGRRLFGARFSRDYVQFAWHVARHWGSGGSGTATLLGYRLEYLNQTYAFFLVHEIIVNASYAFHSQGDAPLIVDCGANIGVSVLFFKARWPHARIIAYEPDLNAFRTLSRNIESNGLQDVRASNVAVGSKDGTVAFYTNVGDPGSLCGSLVPSWGGDSCRSVPMVRLSTHITEPVDLLKVDIEGAELDLLRDLIETGTIDLIREAIIEYHDLNNDSTCVRQLVCTLEAAGFDVGVTAAQPNQRTGILHARRNGRLPKLS
jgi:FkbM family methyltransferase